MLNSTVKRTIDYAAKFGGVLSLEELYLRLLSNKVYSRKKVLEHLKTNNYRLRTKESEYYFEKIMKAKDLAKRLEGRFEDILMMGVTGSVAAGNPDADDDIDLMVITKKDSMWLTRLRLRLYVWKQGIPHRKFNRPQNKDEFCFNLWIDESQMEIPSNRQNMRNAVDLVMMVPVLNKEHAYDNFIWGNGWAKKWVATGYKNIISNFKFQISKNRKNYLKSMLNLICFLGQVGYMVIKLRVDEVGLRKAFFHPRQ